MKKYLLLCALVIVSDYSFAKLSITLTHANHNAIPITLSSDNTTAKNIIVRDLDLSNWIKVTDSANSIHHYALKDNCIYRQEKKIACIHNLSQESETFGHSVSNVLFKDITDKSGWFASKIAMVSSEIKDYKNRLYRLEVTNSLGQNPHVVFSSRSPIMSPTWSPDQRSLAYVSFEGGKASIWVQDLSTGKRSKLSDAPGINGAPAWSPDQKTMALVLSTQGNAKIYLLDLESNHLSLLTPGNSIDTEPVWHPNGKSIFYTSSRGGQPHVYTIDIASKRSERITFHGDYNATPSISKDGKRLATLSRKDGRFMVCVHDLVHNTTKVISAQGSEEQPVIHDSGEIVLFGLRVGNRMQIAMHQVDLPSRYILPSDTGWTRFATWSPSPNIQELH